MEATHRHHVKREVIECMARDMATTCNGGHWRKDYTEDQRELWRERVRMGMSLRVLFFQQKP